MRRLFVLALLTFSGSLGLKAQQWDGLTLYSNMNSTLGYLIDTSSTVVKTFTFTGGTGYSTHMAPGGKVYRSVARMGNLLTGGGITGRMQIVDYNSNVLWDYVYSSSTYVLHHDHCVLPNGNILVITYDVKSASDAASAGASNPVLVWSEKIMEWEPVGTNSVNVVWEWSLWDHLVQNVDNTKANYQPTIVDHPELMDINFNFKKDWVHMNGIDYNPVLDQIVVSSHNLNEWWVIDHSTTTAEAASHNGGKSGKGGDLLYRWGNPATYQAGGSAVLNVTHDAHWIKEGCPNEGYFAGINNKGVTSPSNKTTADQVNPPRSGFTYTLSQGMAYSPANFNARHISTGYTSNMGSVEEYPNGNQMVCLATAGLIYEIDANGTTLWSKNTLGTTPQAHRYSQCYIDHVAPAQPSISVNGSTLSTGSAVSYQWYVNGNAIPGATLQTFVPVQTGTYVVAVTDNNACTKSYSSLLSHTVASVPDQWKEEFNSLQSLGVYPNPGAGVFTIHSELADINKFTLVVYDMSGRVVYTETEPSSVDLSDQSQGIYTFVFVDAYGNKTAKKISLIK